MSELLPFSAFLGHTAARRALLCTLVDPTLRGVIVSGSVGTGKSALLRSFGRWLHEHFGAGIPFVDVPLGVTDDRLLGGVDMEASIAGGSLRGRAGLISSAHGGFLFVDDLPLLEPVATAALLRSVENEVLAVEREGLSARHPSRFVLLATAVPTERDISIDLADRVGFLIGAERISRDSAHLLVTLLDRLRTRPEEVRRLYAPLDAELAERTVAARDRRRHVLVDAGIVRALVERAEEIGVVGSRAEVFAAKAARAHAALRGATAIGDGDIEFAYATVLAPRAQRIPYADEPAPKQRRPTLPPEEEPGDESGTVGEQGRRRSREYASVDAPAGPEREGPHDSRGDVGARADRSDDEVVLEPLDFSAPLAPIAAFFSPRSGVDRGRHGVHAQWLRGRHVRSVQADPQGRRIAIAATLREAAPHQQRRRGEAGGTRVIVRAGDIRVKRFSHRAGTLFIFCVDASGSMARNRVREAKGAVTRLLHDAYVNRDTVALIAFRGAQAEVLLPPTGSVERAKRSIDVLPTGGGTPLASALVKAYTIVELARRRDVTQCVVVVLTDGRANVPLTGNAATMIREVRRRQVRTELEAIGAAYRRAGIRTLVVDTRHAMHPGSEAAGLADLLGGTHYHLPVLDARELERVVRG